MRASEFISQVKSDETRARLLALLVDDREVTTMYDAIDACAPLNVSDIKFLICQRVKAINNKI